RGTVRTAQLEGTEPAELGEEPLFRRYPRNRQAWIQDIAEALAERGVVVTPQRAGDEQAIPEGKPLLDEFADGDRLERLLVRRRRDTARERIRAGGEGLDAGEHAMVADVVIEQPGVGRRIPRGVQRE